jgi:hypothetical protein
MRIPARWREYVKGCADGALPALQRKAINLLAEDRESRQRVRVKAGPRVKAEALAEAEEQGIKDANRAAVMERAGFRCERIVGDPRDPPGARAPHERCGRPAHERDHFWGRARDESVEGSWALCVLCHRAKTENRPSRWYWLWSFGAHAARLGYREQWEKAGRAKALELAQHPERRTA